MTDGDLQRIEGELEKRRTFCRRRVHEAVSTEDLKALLQEMYADWIKNDGYEKDMEVLGFTAHIELAETVSHFIPDRTSRLLDCASGTGLLGQELKKRGFLRIDALDASKESLDYSREKQVYTDYLCEYLGPNRLAIDDDTYDGICMCAAMGKAHVRPDCFPELVRITKPGGYIIFNVRGENLTIDDVLKNGRLDDVIHKMAAKGKFEYLEKKRQMYMQCKCNGKTEYCYAFVLRVM
ncbi:uncharacterized protein LOC119731590 [Patiria miniata]|uniref:Methyltransferase type 11 domain-containing protein n=1 Tax=Patiria miniata TaxID=46514 RepID=A0A914AA32_PATMI|nr:uncharacterized protein LOC119731590 [Patiria miniata]